MPEQKFNLEELIAAWVAMNPSSPLIPDLSPPADPLPEDLPSEYYAAEALIPPDYIPAEYLAEMYNPTDRAHTSMEYQLTEKDLKDIEQRIKAEKAGFESFTKGLEEANRIFAEGLTEEALEILLRGDE